MSPYIGTRGQLLEGVGCQTAVSSKKLNIINIAFVYCAMAASLWNDDAGADLMGMLRDRKATIK